MGLLAVLLLTTTQHHLGAAGQSPALAPASLPLVASSGSSNATAGVQGFIKVQGLEFVDGCGDRFIPVGWNRWALTGSHWCLQESSLSTQVHTWVCTLPVTDGGCHMHGGCL